MYAFTCVFDGTVQLVGASVVDAWKTDWYKFSLFKYTGGKEEKQKNGEILRGCPTKKLSGSCIGGDCRLVLSGNFSSCTDLVVTDVSRYLKA